MQVVKQASVQFIHKVLQPELQQLYQRRAVPIFPDPAAKFKPQVHIPGQHQQQYYGKQQHQWSQCEHRDCSVEVAHGKSTESGGVEGKAEIELL